MLLFVAFRMRRAYLRAKDFARRRRPFVNAKAGVVPSHRAARFYIQSI